MIEGCTHPDWKYTGSADGIIKVCIKCGEPIKIEMSYLLPSQRYPENDSTYGFYNRITRIGMVYVDGVLVDKEENISESRFTELRHKHKVYVAHILTG